MERQESGRRGGGREVTVQLEGFVCEEQAGKTDSWEVIWVSKRKLQPLGKEGRGIQGPRLALGTNSFKTLWAT